MKCSAFIACSLDGFIAGKDGSLDWLSRIPNPENDDFGYLAFMKGIDAIVMGRKTFETVLGFDPWPYAVPVFVLSRSLKALPPAVDGKASLLSGSPADVAEALGGMGFTSLYIDGGATIAEFLGAGLLDEMTITRVSALLGDGIPLFPPGLGVAGETWFEAVEGPAKNPSFTQTRYIRRSAGL